MKLEYALAAVLRLGLDSSPIIYLIEAHPRYDALVTAVFRRITAGELTGFTSAISLTEVLVHPLSRGDLGLAARYRQVLGSGGQVRMVPADESVAERAAELRARYRLRTPDALQIATALLSGCEAFLTNDLGLRRVAELRIPVLDDLEL